MVASTAATMAVSKVELWAAMTAVCWAVQKGQMMVEP
jgi:hypothetical protein